MANSLVQFRVADNIKEDATHVCVAIGIDLQVYLRLCLFKLVQEQGIPFSMKVKREKNDPLSQLQQQAKEAGITNMTLDEINAEIAAYRRESRASGE